MLIELHPLYLARRSSDPTWDRNHLGLVPLSVMGVKQLPSSGLDPGTCLVQVEHEESQLEVVGVYLGVLGMSQGREMKTGLGSGSLRVTEQAG